VSITLPLFGGGAPFFEGSFADPRNVPYAINLDGRDYPIDLKEYRHNGIDRFRQGVITSGEPNDQLFDTTGAWWRYRFSWHQGSDQAVGDLAEEASPSRYATSRGVDPWTKYQLCLLNDTERVLEVAADRISMVATNQFVYVSDGTGVKRSADLVTWTALTGLAGTVNDLATDGTNVYIATTSNMYTVAPAGVAASVTTVAGPQAFDSVAFVANRLLAGSSNVISEVTATTIDDIYTHFQPAFRWRAIFNVGSRIYVGGFAGNRSELYSLSTDDTGVLIRSAEATSFFSGELLQDALAYGGSVILATSEGVRFAQIGGDGTLQYGPLLNDMGSTKCLAAQGRFAWFGWENFPGDGTGIGRLALDEFVAPLAPAYATDLFTEAANTDIEAVARFGDRTLFAVSGNGVYASDPTAWVTEGHLDSGDMTFGTVENKSLSQFRAKFAALADGETVGVTLTDEDEVVVGTRTVSTDGAGELTLDLQTEEISRVNVRMRLAGDGTSTPCVRQWRLRAYPVAPTTEEWLVPLLIQSQVVVNDSEGQILSLDPWLETSHIRDLWERSAIVLYKEGDHAFRVRIDNFQISAIEWRDGSDWMEIRCIVRLLSA
jgi:hypothetical protein